jgi:hypothetical protein
MVRNSSGFLRLIPQRTPHRGFVWPWLVVALSRGQLVNHFVANPLTTITEPRHAPYTGTQSSPVLEHVKALLPWQTMTRNAHGGQPS